MKHFKVILIVAFIVLCAACGKRYTNHKLILQAENLLTTHPDSAYALLESIPHPEHLPAPDYAAWCLHYMHARYKLYMETNSDSLVKVAMNYYRDTRYKNYYGVACYLDGCILMLQDQRAEAIKRYREADISLSGSKDYNVLGLNAFNMSRIYLYEENYTRGYLCTLKAYKYFKITKNYNYLMYAYEQLSELTLQMDESLTNGVYPKIPLKYSDIALKYACKAGDTLSFYRITARQGELVYDIDRKTGIRKLRTGFYHYPPKKQNYAAFLAYLYAKENNRDSAAYFFNQGKQALQSKGDEIFKYLTRAAMYENLNNYKLAYKSMEKAYLHQDTLFRQKLRNQSYKAEKQFDLSVKEKENARLKIQNQAHIIFIALLIIIFLVLVLILLFIIYRYKKKHADQVLKQKQTEYELRTKVLANQKKRELLMAKLREKINLTLRLEKLKKGGYNEQKQIKLTEDLLVEMVMDKQEWQVYIDEIDRMFENRISRLKNQYTDLTGQDMIVIALMCVGLDIAELCALLNMTKETMYTRRKRIKKRLEITDDLEVWIAGHLVGPNHTAN